MNDITTKNQLTDILKRERKRLGLDKSMTNEQVVYAKAETITKDVVREARVIIENSTGSMVVFDNEHLKTHMQKQFAHRLMQEFTKEEMGFLLSVMLATEVAI